MKSTKCERCERAARFHETVLENGAVVERHFCTRHGKPVWFNACHKLMVEAVGALPDDLLPRDIDRSELQARLAAAKNLATARSAIQRKP